MMTVKKSKSEIEQLTSFLLSKGLILDYNSPKITQLGTDSFSISWASTNSMKNKNRNFASIPEYINLIYNREYNFILFDGSLFQFSFIYRHREIIKARLLYYPCPLNISQEDIEDIQLGEDFINLFFLLLEEQTDLIISNLSLPKFPLLKLELINKSPFCFDFDVENSRSNHSASHLHINDHNCRWPIYGPISPGHFIRLIFHLFYTEIWETYEEIRQWPLTLNHRTILSEHTSELFIECNN